jgi:hypothetical protein
LAKYLRVTMPDGTYDIPLEVIALSMATHYAYDYEGSVERCLDEEVNPQFAEDTYNATDWAANSMNWSDVADHAVKILTPVPKVDYEREWVNAHKRVVEV